MAPSPNELAEMERMKKELAEMADLKKRMAETELEMKKLRENESTLKKQLESAKSGASSSKTPPVTPWSHLVKHFDFSAFSPKASKQADNVIDLEGEKLDEEPAENPAATLMMAMMQEIQSLNQKITKIPGLPPTLEKAAPDCYADTPFDDNIALVETHEKFQPPIMKAYDGTTDPREHINMYRQKIISSNTPNEKREVCMCKGFGSTLTGAALQWYINIPNKTIRCFADLVNMFNQQFASSRVMEKQTSDLYRITQKPEETIKTYLNRFNKEKISIPRCDIATAVEAFRQGLVRDSEIYRELTKYPCSTFEDVQAKCLAYIRLEDDNNFRITPQGNSRKAPTSRPTPERPVPYSRSGRSSVNSVQAERHSEFPDICEYNFSVDYAGLINRLDNLGSAVRWPKTPEKPNPRRDTTKWCQFHSDIGHTTEDCHQLKREVAILLKKGYLKDLLSKPLRDPPKKGDSNPEPKLPPPPATQNLFYISGGSELCGLTYSAAKRVAKENKMQPPIGIPDHHDTISFDESDIQGVQGPHHDGLVITLQVGTTMVRRVLIDGGSSVNLIMLSSLKEMGIPEEKLIKKSNVLVGFSGETKHTIGEIHLPTYVDGVTSFEKFCVIDCLSSYNIILGRPWIHNLKAVPSTYHQCVKIPTKWGVVTIRGEQQAAQECYRTALKPAPKPEEPGKSTI